MAEGGGNPVFEADQSSSAKSACLPVVNLSQLASVPRMESIVRLQERAVEWFTVFQAAVHSKQTSEVLAAAEEFERIRDVLYPMLEKLLASLPFDSEKFGEVDAIKRALVRRRIEVCEGLEKAKLGFESPNAKSETKTSSQTKEPGVGNLPSTCLLYTSDAADD